LTELVVQNKNTQKDKIKTKARSQNTGREKRRSTQNKIQMSKNGRALIQNRQRCEGEKTKEFRTKIGIKRGARKDTRGTEQRQKKSRQKNTHSNHILMELPVSLIAGNRFPIENLREFGFYSCVMDLF
jgi:hypothetical protein